MKDKLTYHKNIYTKLHLLEDKKIHSEIYIRVFKNTDFSYYDIYKYYNKISSIEFWKNFLEQHSHTVLSKQFFIDDNISTVKISTTEA